MWEDLKEAFIAIPLPCSKKKFLTLFYKYYKKITKHDFGDEESFFMDKYSHGGMSSGMISARFWREKAIYIIVNRLELINKIKIAIDEWNPYSLLPCASEDEFLSETKKVADRISNENKVDEIAQVVSEVFTKSFSDEVKFSKENCMEVSKKIKDFINVSNI